MAIYISRMFHKDESLDNCWKMHKRKRQIEVSNLTVLRELPFSDMLYFVLTQGKIQEETKGCKPSMQLLISEGSSKEHKL